MQRSLGRAPICIDNYQCGGDERADENRPRRDTDKALHRQGGYRSDKCNDQHNTYREPEMIKICHFARQ